MKTTPTVVAFPLAVAVAAISALFAGCDTGGNSASSSTPLPLTQEGAVPAVPDPVEVYVMKVDGQPRLLTMLSDDPMWAWAPDDDHAALITDLRTGPATIHVISVKAGTETATVDIAGFPRNFTWSPNGEWLAWETLDLHAIVLEVMRADGTDRQQLASNDAYTWAQYGVVFGWKDDHTLLATVWEDPNSILFEFDVVSGSKREVGLQPAGATAAELSQDASRVVFVVSGSLWVMDVSDGNLRQVLSDAHLFNDASWSPDGSQIAYEAGGSEDIRGTYILDVASGASRKLGGSAAQFDHVRGWSPDGGTVLVDRSDCPGTHLPCPGSLPELVLIPVAGGDENVISGDAFHFLSPNGAAVAFEKDGLQVAQIPSGSARQVMAANPDWQFNLLGWSPDGQWFAFARSHSVGSRQFEVNADGSGLTRLEDIEGTATPIPRAVNVPSPNGMRVAVLLMQLYIQDADGSHAVPVDELLGGEVSWSPDSNHLVYTSCVNTECDSSPLLLVSADGSISKALTKGSPPDLGPTFSPDGQQVAFVRVAHDTEEVMTIDLNTGEEKTLFTIGRGRWLDVDGPVWSPDGSMLAFREQGVGTYVIKTDGSGGHQVVAVDQWHGYLTGLRWQSNSTLYFVSTWR